VSGYSETPLLQKLGIREGTRMAVVNAPADFRDNLGELPLAVEWANRVRPPLDIVVTFNTRLSTLVAQWPTLTASVSPDGVVWVAWPKKASGLETDISDDVLRDALAKSRWVDNNACAIDEVYSGMRFALRKDSRPKKKPSAAKPAKLRKPKPGAHR